MISKETVLENAAIVAKGFANCVSAKLNQLSLAEICEEFCKAMIGVRGTRGLLISVGESDETNPLKVLQAQHAQELALKSANLQDQLHDCRVELHDTQTQESLLDRVNRGQAVTIDRLAAETLRLDRLLTTQHMRAELAERALHEVSTSCSYASMQEANGKIAQYKARIRSLETQRDMAIVCLDPSTVHIEMKDGKPVYS